MLVALVKFVWAAAPKLRATTHWLVTAPNSFSSRKFVPAPAGDCCKESRALLTWIDIAKRFERAPSNTLVADKLVLNKLLVSTRALLRESDRFVARIATTIFCR